MQKANSLTIDMAKDHVLDNILGDWLGSVSYVSSKVTIKSPPRSGGREQAQGRLQDINIRLQERTWQWQRKRLLGSMDWTSPNSGGIYTAENLTRPGAMGACMF